jgi:SAM-dependent methyltransferase
MKYLNIGSCEFKKEGWLTLDKAQEHYSSRQAHIDINHDLMGFNYIALEDNSLDIAYTSHTIEHISDKYVNHLFNQVYRLLKPGGVFRITCPDIGKCYDAYKENNKDYIDKWLLNPAGWEFFRSKGIGEEFLFIFATYLSPCFKNETGFKKYKEEEVSQIFTQYPKEAALSLFTDICQHMAETLQTHYPGAHISWWDFDKLKEILSGIGFSSIERSEFDSSETSELVGFDSSNSDNVKCLDYTLFLECKKP